MTDDDDDDDEDDDVVFTEQEHGWAEEDIHCFIYAIQDFLCEEWVQVRHLPIDHPFDLLMPNGKLLDDCTVSELHAMAVKHLSSKLAAMQARAASGDVDECLRNEAQNFWRVSNFMFSAFPKPIHEKIVALQAQLGVDVTEYEKPVER